MPSIFISHSSHDKPIVADWIVSTLTQALFQVWWDRMLIGGKPWKAQLAEAIRRCDILLFAATRESLESQWCLWELQEAYRQHKPIIPVKLRRNIDPPAWLTEIQFIDFSDGLKVERAIQLITAVTQADRYVLHDLDPRFLIEQPQGTPTNAVGADAPASAPGPLVPPSAAAVPAEPSAEAAALYEQADALYERGRFDEAIALLNRAIAAAPAYAEAYNRRGACFLEIRDVGRAEQDFAEALRLKPGMARALNNMGIVWRLREQYETALDWYTRALQADPALVVAYENRGDLHLMLERPKEALADYRKAIDLTGGRVGKYHASLGGALLALDRPDEAIASVNRALELEPNNADFVRQLATIYTLQNRVREAGDAFDRLLQLNRRDFLGFLGRANVRMALNDVHGARADISFAASLASTDDERSYCESTSGDLFFKQGRLNEAAAAYQRALRLSPGNEYAQRQLRSVQERL
ncbi:MAG: tetratricopeptide repeat protein [Candidatus Flexifilum sp.]